jgi:hypothetical protein
MAKKLTVYFDEVDYFELTSSAEKMKMKPLELVYKRYEEGKEKNKTKEDISDLRNSISKINSSLDSLKQDLKSCFMNMANNIVTVRYESAVRLKKEYDDESKLQKVREDINVKAEEAALFIEQKFN